MEIIIAYDVLVGVSFGNSLNFSHIEINQIVQYSQLLIDFTEVFIFRPLGPSEFLYKGTC